MDRKFGRPLRLFTHITDGYTSILFICFLSSSCLGPVKKGPLQWGISPTTRALMQSVSFQQVQIEVFQKKCIACHGNSGGVNLESYPSAFQNLTAINRSVFKTGTMPRTPFSPLTKREAEVLRAWIEAGGPERPIGNTGGGNEPNPEPLPIEPTYASIKGHVLDMKCISCHSPGGTVARIPLVTKDDLLNSSLDLVIPGEPDESGLTIVLEPGARKFMPPADSGISPVSEEERNAIRTWILNGAP